jgi:hypothetical protein
MEEDMRRNVLMLRCSKISDINKASIEGKAGWCQEGLFTSTERFDLMEACGLESVQSEELKAIKCEIT